MIIHTTGSGHHDYYGPAVESLATRIQLEAVMGLSTEWNYRCAEQAAEVAEMAARATAVERES